MTLRLKILLSILGLLSAFSLGRYSINASPKVTSQESVQTHVDTHVVRTQVTTKSGGVKITTVTDSHEIRHEDVKTIVMPPTRRPLNLSVSVGTTIGNPLAPIYGLHLTKEILGPLTIGGYVLTNGTVGVSLGMNF